MARSFSVAQILEWTSGRLVNGDALGGALAGIAVGAPRPLAGSGPTDLAFFFSPRYRAELLGAAPGVLVTGEAFVGPLAASGLPIWRKSAVIACADPYFAMAILSEKFAAELSSAAHLPAELAKRGGAAAVHPTAVVHPSAKLAEGVEVGPHCVIEAEARVGRGTVLYPRVYVGKQAEIGEACVLFPGVTLYEWTKLGDRVRIHANSTLGSDGFGYAQRTEEGKPVEHRKIYHLGRVVVGDDVEIGADCAIDRATLGETRVGDQVKLDNHVHIGHNTELGEGTMLAGGAMTAGGTVIKRFAFVGGMAGVGNKATVGDFAKIAGMSFVDKDIPEGGTAIGNPMRTHREHFKAHALLNRLLADKERPKEKK